MIDTPEMVERVARRICIALGGRPDDEIGMGEAERTIVGYAYVLPPAERRYKLWTRFINAAEGAICDMREPTKEMLAVPKDIMGGGWQNSHSDLETWQAMVDAALGRKE